MGVSNMERDVDCDHVRGRLVEGSLLEREMPDEVCCQRC